MASPDFFGISDRIRQLTAPPGFEAVHEDGFSWARQGTTWNDTTKIGPTEWNMLIGNLRGIGLMPDAVSNEFDPSGPYLLRDALVNFVTVRVDYLIEPYMTSINAALALKAPLASPTFTGTPAAPTPGNADNSTRLATTAYVKALFTDLYGGAVSSDFDTIAEIETKVATKAPLASPTLTGVPTAPTPGNADNSTRLATTAYVKALFTDLYGGAVASDMDTIAEIVAAIALKAPLASPALTGTPTAPTPGNADNSTRLATTAYVKALFTDLYGGAVASDMDTIAEIVAAIALKAPLASPALTGTPTAPTPAAGTNSTRIATTAFVQALADNIYGGAVASDMDSFADLELAIGGRLSRSGDTGTGTYVFLGSFHAPAAPPTGTSFHLSQQGDSTRVLIDNYFTGAGGPNLTMRKARGTAAARSALQVGDQMINIAAFGYGATGYSAGTRGGLLVAATEAWSDSAQGADLALLATPIGTTGSVTHLRAADNHVRLGDTAIIDLQMGGANTVIDTNRLFRLRSYTVAALPTPGTAGRMAFASNCRVMSDGGMMEGGAGSGGLVVDNGTNWKVAGTNVTAAG